MPKSKTIKMKALTRKQFLALFKAILRENEVDEDLIAIAIERAYPMATCEVPPELFIRGLVASEWDLKKFMSDESNGVRLIGRTRVWSQANVDYLAEELEAAGKFAPSVYIFADEGKTLWDGVKELEERFAPEIIEKLYAH